MQAADYFSEMPKQVELFSEGAPVRITYPVPVNSVSVFSSSGDGELYLRNALNFSSFRRDRYSLLFRFYADSNFSIAKQSKSNLYDEYTHFLAPLNPTLSTTIKGVCPESILL